MRTVGVNLPTCPGKGYGATFKRIKPAQAPFVSMIDDQVKGAMTRLGYYLRAAGTIEIGGYNLSLTTPLAKARCAKLARRVEQVLPGLCDTRLESGGGTPNFWCCLRLTTSTNISYIGQTKVCKLWVNASNGTRGCTPGSGKAIAELISRQKPGLKFGFLGA